MRSFRKSNRQALVHSIVMMNRLSANIAPSHEYANLLTCYFREAEADLLKCSKNRQTDG
jgi:hypothetical protein